MGILEIILQRQARIEGYMSFLSCSAIGQLFMRDVATWGDINVDIVDRLPYYARLANDSVADRIGIHSGGSAANAATVLSRSAPSVDTVAQAGPDTFAKYTRDLKDGALSLSWVQEVVQAMTALLFAGLARDGEGTLSRCRGASPRTPPEFAGESYVHQAQVWHASGDAVLARPQRDAAQQAIQVAHWGAAPAILDVDVEVMTTIRAAIARILSTASMVYPNRATAKLADWLGKRC